jgi:hypothetical protein
VYGTTTSYGQFTPVQTIPGSNSTQSVSANVAGLLPGTTYHFELVAVVGSPPYSQTFLGGDNTFTTQPSTGPGPSVTTGGATSVTQTSATLNGTVNSDGLPVQYAFVWGTTTSYGNETPPQGTAGGSMPQSVSANIAGLTPGTTYHYQLVAAVGQPPYSAFRDGGDQTFTTQPGAGPGSGTGTPTGRLKLLRKRLSVHGGTVQILLQCASTRRCTGGLTITTARAVGTVVRRVSCVFAKRFAISAGAKHKVKAKLRSGCLALLRRAPRHRRNAFFRASLSTGQPDFSTGVTLIGG